MAVSCAAEMFKKMPSINNSLEANNLPQIKGIGIGIHFGNVIAGDIGSIDRANYTYIGDNVNVASRLESLTKKSKRNIFISEDVYTLLDESIQNDFSKIKNAVTLKGKKNPIYIYYHKQS